MKMGCHADHDHDHDPVACRLPTDVAMMVVVMMMMGHGDSNDKWQIEVLDMLLLVTWCYHEFLVSCQAFFWGGGGETTAENLHPLLTVDGPSAVAVVSRNQWEMCCRIQIPERMWEHDLETTEPQ